MIKLIGSILLSGVVSILPVTKDNAVETEDIMAYTCVKEVLSEVEEDTDDINENGSAASPLFFWDGCGSTYDEAVVYTPNGSPVTVLIDKRTPSKSEIAKWNQKGDTKVPEATRIGDSTLKYNCHSYAWYQQSTDNPYWMEDPTIYYSDGSYFEVEVPHINDRICYFDSYGKNIHSGVVKEVYAGTSNGVCGNSNLVKVISKWGEQGLYEHRGDQCPYTHKYEGTAVEVRYYHRHNYSYGYTNLNNSQHTAYCICGASVTENHIFTYSNKTALGHTENCVCGRSVTEIHIWTPYSNPMWGGGRQYVQCKKCFFIKELGKDEVIPVVPNRIKQLPQYK